jgi:hypothetical protein
MGCDVGWRELDFDAVFPGFDLDDAFGETLVSDDDLEGGPHQVCIVEFHASPFISIVPEDF